MISFQYRDDKLSFAVVIVPRASRSEVVGEHAGSLRIRIAAPPVDGAANAELIRLLAKLFSVPRGKVSIISGERGKSKLISIAGGDSKILQELSSERL